jgi:replicative DNA helicase
MQAYKTTPSDIDALIRNLDVTSNGELKPDVVIVDYLGLLSPTNMNSRMGLYEKGMAISVELRALAQMYEIPFLVAAQTNRQSFADRVDQDKISDSIGIAQTCDLLMTVNRNEDMDKDDQVVIFLAKSRFCKNGQTFTFHVNYDNMRVEDMMGGVSTANSDNTTEKSE